MPLFRTDAIVIRSMDFSESDKIVTFFTRDFGKLRGIAKGAKKSKKRFGNTLELFSHISLFFFQKENLELARINNCSIIRSHMEIYKDIEKMAYGSYFIELVNELVGEREKNSEIFNLLVDSLSLINDHKLGEEIARIFEIRILSLVGYQPQLDECLKCGHRLSNGEIFWFSPVKGGVVCSKCTSGQVNLSPISPGTLKILLLARDMDFKKIQRLIFSRQALIESKEAITNFVQHQMGKEPNSIKFLKKINGLA
ncbi:MAG: DNA repair protein RecO [Pseudomonadota bacterium]